MARYVDKQQQSKINPHSHRRRKKKPKTKKTQQFHCYLSCMPDQIEEIPPMSGKFLHKP